MVIKAGLLKTCQYIHNKLYFYQLFTLCGLSSKDLFVLKPSRKTMLDIFCFRISSVNLFPASSLDVESIKDDNSPRNPMIHSLNHICKAILQRSAASSVLTVICQELEQALKKKKAKQGTLICKIHYLNGLKRRTIFL